MPSPSPRVRLRRPAIIRDSRLLASTHDQAKSIFFKNRADSASRRRTVPSIRVHRWHFYEIPTTRPLGGFLSPKFRKQRHRPTNSQTSVKPEGDVFAAGSGSAQKLLALCHTAVSDPWYLEVRFRELIARATLHAEKPPACAGGSFSCSRVALTG